MRSACDGMPGYTETERAGLLWQDALVELSLEDCPDGLRPRLLAEQGRPQARFLMPVLALQ